MNDPTMLILASLSTEDRHGYALQQDIEAFAGVRLGPGTLYGAICRLEERGWIEPLDGDGRRRPYRLTAAGADALRASTEQMQAVLARAMTGLTQRYRPRRFPGGVVA